MIRLLQQVQERCRSFKTINLVSIKIQNAIKMSRGFLFLTKIRFLVIETKPPDLHEGLLSADEFLPSSVKLDLSLVEGTPLRGDF